MPVVFTFSKCQLQLRPTNSTENVYLQPLKSPVLGPQGLLDASPPAEQGPVGDTNTTKPLRGLTLQGWRQVSTHTGLIRAQRGNQEGSAGSVLRVRSVRRACGGEGRRSHRPAWYTQSGTGPTLALQLTTGHLSRASGPSSVSFGDAQDVGCSEHKNGACLGGDAQHPSTWQGSHRLPQKPFLPSTFPHLSCGKWYHCNSSP